MKAADISTGKQMLANSPTASKNTTSYFKGEPSPREILWQADFDRQLKLAIPFSAFFLTLFAIPTSLLLARQSRFASVVATIGMALVWVLLYSIYFTYVVSHPNILSPMLDVWLPNILTGVVGLSLIAVHYWLPPKENKEDNRDHIPLC